MCPHIARCRAKFYKGWFTFFDYIRKGKKSLNKNENQKFTLGDDIYIYIGAILLQIQDKIGSVQIGGDFICVRYEQI